MDGALILFALTFAASPLHRGGLYFVWFVFFACLSTRLVEKSDRLLSLDYVPFLALLLAVLAVRGAAWRSTRLAAAP